MSGSGVSVGSAAKEADKASSACFISPRSAMRTRFSDIVNNAMMVGMVQITTAKMVHQPAGEPDFACPGSGNGAIVIVSSGWNSSSMFRRMRTLPSEKCCRLVKLDRVGVIEKPRTEISVMQMGKRRVTTTYLSPLAL